MSIQTPSFGGGGYTPKLKLFLGFCLLIVKIVGIVSRFYLPAKYCLSLSLHLGKFPGEPINIVYVPSHLFHMLFELFKVCQYMLFLPLVF